MIAVYLIAGVLLLGGVGWKAYDLGEDNARAEAQEAIDKANREKQNADDRYSAGLNDRAAILTAATAALSRPQPDPKSLVVQLPPAAPGQPAVPCTDRSPDYRLRYNAAATGGTP